MDTLLDPQLIGQVGLPIVLLIVFLKRDFRRDRIAEKEKKYLLGRIENIERYQREVLQKTVESATTVMTEVKMVMSKCSKD